MNVIGVDAGGTQTTAALASGGAFVREGHGPAANATTIGVADAADAMLQAIREAAHGAPLDAIYVGAAGAGRPEIAHELESLIGSAYADARVVVTDDTAIALRSRVPSGPGAVLIVGTGSVAYAENGDVRMQVGGLGHLLGDEGSAFAIGLAAVKLYGRVLDGRAVRDETSDLAARAMDATDRPTLLAAMYDVRLEPAKIAALAPSIIAFADKGNRASTKIVQEASKELGDLLKAAVKAAGLLEASPAIALAGGLMRENSLLTFLLETRIIGDIPGAAIVRAGDEPVQGALRLAHTLAARPV